MVKASLFCRGAYIIKPMVQHSLVTSRINSKNFFHEYMIPYVYLGMDSYRFFSSFSGKEMAITSGVFDDRMFAKVKIAFVADFSAAPKRRYY